MGIFRRINNRIAFIAVAFLILTLMSVQKAECSDTITFRVIAVNPSKTKMQTTQVKKYLPEEVSPKDIIELSGLEAEYDPAKSLYYVYKNHLELAPREVRTFEIEIKDIWIVPRQQLSDLEERTDSILAQLEDTEYYAKAKEIADTIYLRLNDIATLQTNEEVSRQQHIGIYRQNLITLEKIKEDAARMEKILVTAGGPPAPEMLADTRVKVDSPSRTMTWIVIFSIIVFTGLLASVLFFTWHRQASVTDGEILSAKKSAFPESVDKEGIDENETSELPI